MERLKTASADSFEARNEPLKASNSTRVLLTSVRNWTGSSENKKKRKVRRVHLPSPPAESPDPSPERSGCLIPPGPRHGSEGPV